MKLSLYCLELCSFLSKFMLSDFQFSFTAIFLSHWFLFLQETKQSFSYTTLQQSCAALPAQESLSVAAFPAFCYNPLGKVIDNVRKTANFMPNSSTYLSKSWMTQTAENLVKIKVNCHATRTIPILKGEFKKKKLIEKYRGWVVSVPSPSLHPSYPHLKRWEAHGKGTPSNIARQNLLSPKS